MTISLRLLLGLFLAAVPVVAVVCQEHRASIRRTPQKGVSTSYTTPFYLLMLTYWVIFLLKILSQGRRLTDTLFSFCLMLFLQLSLYNLLLLALLPLLRRWFKPQTCALLWLLPIYLYVLQYDGMAPSHPLLILQVPDLPVGPILLVWGIGFVAVLGWKILSHFRFRRTILAAARPADDPAILALWQDLQDRLCPNRDKRYPLVISPQVQSPLSIGIWNICVVLQEHPYPPEHLTLILRHELLHILRQDSISKLFLTICTALCWFNPLMWLGTDRSAQDMELSCDEAVLSGADSDTRRVYAGLLLDTADDPRGFTSCLSASASALRYRLKRIVKPARRLTGSLLVGVITFGLVMSSGLLSLTYETRSCADLLFAGRPEACTLLAVDGKTAMTSQEQDILTYLSELEGRRITGTYTFSDVSHKLELRYDGPDGARTVALADDLLIRRPRASEHPQEEVYLLSGGVDWDYLTQLLEAAAPTA